jgi:hypothetical protein
MGTAEDESNCTKVEADDVLGTTDVAAPSGSAAEWFCATWFTIVTVMKYTKSSRKMADAAVLFFKAKRSRHAISSRKTHSSSTVF